VKGIAFLIIGSTFRIHGNAILFGSGLAVGRHSFNLDAELAFELKEIGALFPQKRVKQRRVSGAAVRPTRWMKFRRRREDHS